MELNPLPDAEIQHRAVRAHLMEESESSHNLVVQLDEFFFGKRINVDTAHCACRSPAESYIASKTPPVSTCVALLHGTGYSCTSGIGKSFRLSVSSAHPRSIAVAATIVSARLSVRPFCPQMLLICPAKRTIDALTSCYSRPLTNDSILTLSPALTP